MNLPGVPAVELESSSQNQSWFIINFVCKMFLKDVIMTVVF